MCFFVLFQDLKIRHLAGLICKTLDLALTRKTIKSGFRAIGIMPFDPDIFSEADYIEAVEQAPKLYTSEPITPEPNTPEPITPEPSTSISYVSSERNLSILDEVGPVGG